MDEGGVSESVPDLKELEVKVGRKTPEGLLRCLRGDAVLRGQESVQCTSPTLDGKIRRLRVEMAHLRAVDVRILQQLLALHEGIEAVKWLMEERGTLTSHCSSLTSSQYSLGEGPDTSLRGSWSSLQDPHDKLDNVSIGSYLDTLADDLDEYSPSSGADSVLCSTPLGVDNSTRTGAGAGPGNKLTQVKPSKEDAPDCNKAPEVKSKTSPVVRSNSSEGSRDSGVVDIEVKKDTELDSPKLLLAEKLAKNLSPKGKPYKNGKVELESCKMNGKVHLEYDAHWRWVQSQDDVTFL